MYLRTKDVVILGEFITEWFSSLSIVEGNFWQPQCIVDHKVEMVVIAQDMDPVNREQKSVSHSMILPQLWWRLQGRVVGQQLN